MPARLAYLFATVYPLGGKESSPREVAQWIQRHGGKLSEPYIQKILNGERPTPGPGPRRLLGRYFLVPAGFFADQRSDPVVEIEPELWRLLATVRDNPRVRAMIYRLVRLSDGAQDALLDIAAASLRAEGKPTDPLDDNAE